jgi:hypothetical protein
LSTEDHSGEQERLQVDRESLDDQRQVRLLAQRGQSQVQDHPQQNWEVKPYASYSQDTRQRRMLRSHSDREPPVREMMIAAAAIGRRHR